MVFLSFTNLTLGMVDSFPLSVFPPQVGRSCKANLSNGVFREIIRPSEVKFQDWRTRFVPSASTGLVG
jgi:hypothetical protein